MDTKERRYYEGYLKQFPEDYSIVVQLVKTVLDQETRIIELEKKTK